MSLLEVILALTILLMALIPLGRLVIISGERAREVHDLAVATQLCQSKLGEVVAGVVPLSSVSGTPFEEDESWTWSMDCSQGDIPNLWDVHVTVRRAGSGESQVEVTLDQKVLDPSVRGTTFDAWANANSASGTSSTGSGSSSSSSSTSGSTPGGP
jgi:hypothetical protein